MNQSTLTRLKIIVERVVRPVPAGTARKQRMREELLAHVTAVFEEEAARLGDEKAALERTKERFGNPDELTGQLLKSVPPKDFAERLMDRVVLVVVFWLALFGAAEIPPFPGRILLDGCFFLVGFIFLADLMRRALYGAPGRSWRHALLVAASCLLLFAGLLFFSLEFLFDEWSQPSDMFNIFLLTATLTWGLATAVLEAAARFRSQVDWGSLQIE